ncbi:RNA polymerase sigma-70 factor [Parapedobacter deserti]|uniref:RNA polymerase sigma-70 factor n=1 Tax=Parapedobacter deserti TaxID=1912957 RepID=A0ABV7JGB4_9SPHI
MATSNGSGMDGDQLKGKSTKPCVGDDSLRLQFNAIFHTYEQPLFRLAANLCKDEDMARDIVHDVFLKLWEIRQQLHQIESIEAFLYTLTRNKIMDYLRKVASDARLKQAIWESMQEVLHADSNTMEAKEFRDILNGAIDQLPAQRKAVYLLRDAGYNYNEISDRLNISRHTVKNQVSAALKTIRKAIGNFFN